MLMERILVTLWTLQSSGRHHDLLPKYLSHQSDLWLSTPIWNYFSNVEFQIWTRQIAVLCGRYTIRTTSGLIWAPCFKLLMSGPIIVPCSKLLIPSFYIVYRVECRSNVFWILIQSFYTACRMWNVKATCSKLLIQSFYTGATHGPVKAPCSELLTSGLILWFYTEMIIVQWIPYMYLDLSKQSCNFLTWIWNKTSIFHIQIV